MRVEHRASPATLPALAWCARVQRDTGRIELWAGAGVEIRADGGGFFEGAWAGAFADWDFDRSSHVYGSGAIARADRAIFVTPSHTCERLQVMRPDPRTLLISNSLCFLLAIGDDALDAHYAGYPRRFSRIVDGIGRFRTAIPTARGRTVELIYFRNFEVAEDLRIAWLDKPPVGTLPDFASYDRLLMETVASVAANGADAARRARRYRLLTTVSSGYDSAACAALARRNRCTRALTLAEGRSLGKRSGEDDSGTAVADAIGLETQVFSRLDYQRVARACPEAEFLATGMSGEDVTFVAFERELDGQLLLTGFHGDKVWNRHAVPNAVLKRGDLSGASLGEFRLRTNFVHLPVPFIGALRHADLHALANHRELAAWSVGGAYDRPLPRRLAEEAGAPRHAFGQAKKATTAQMHAEGLDAMSPSTRSELLGFAQRLGLPLSTRLRFRADALAERCRQAMCHLLVRSRATRLLPPGKRRPRAYPVHLHTPLGALPLVWATQRVMRERYACDSAEPVVTARTGAAVGPVAAKV